MIAALVYHYEPDADGGTAITDVFINDGDFARPAPQRRRLRRPPDRRPPSRDRRRPQPAPPLSDPDDGLRGLERGRRPDRAADARRQPFRRVRGRRARPALPVSGPRAGPKRTARARRCAGFATSAARARAAPTGPGSTVSSPATCPAFVRRRSARALVAADPAADEAGPPRAARAPASRVQRAASARALRGFLDRLAREIGARPRGRARYARASTMLGRGPARACSTEAQAPADARDELADDVLARWPYRSMDHLLARGARRAPAAPAQEPHRTWRRGRATTNRGRWPASVPCRTRRQRGAPARQPGGFRRLAAPRAAARRRPCACSRRSRRTWTRPCIDRGVGLLRPRACR